ncbi:MAG: hypothetical protein ACAI35_27175 [Candidatus Methylacidiphilales bacterium]|nr:hypothetical protein [Candidatus Methylacidiphilales bacterium]
MDSPQSSPAEAASADPLQALYQTLTAYLDAVPRQKEPNPPDLRALFRQLDEAERTLPASAHPQLRHYMHQKSYRKAWLFLQERDAENAAGNCGRH